MISRRCQRKYPLAKRPQKWWDLLSILGGIASAILWLLYSGIREGFDFLTPLLMIAIPVFMIWFREDLDVVLLGLQPYRKDVNKVLLVGIGMAFPFLTAFVLFNLGIRNYPLIQWNMLIGTFGAYAITRNPVISMPGMGAQPGAGQRPVPATHGILLLLAAAMARSLSSRCGPMTHPGYPERPGLPADRRLCRRNFRMASPRSCQHPSTGRPSSRPFPERDPGTPDAVQPTQPAQPSTPPAPPTPADQAGSAGP